MNRRPFTAYPVEVEREKYKADLKLDQKKDKQK